MSAAVAAIGIGAVGLYQGYKAGQRADEALGQQANTARGQLTISQQQVDLANEQWDLYKNKIYPLELEAQQLGLDYKKLAFDQYEEFYKPMGDKFAQSAMEGVEAQPERAARDARLAVDQQFDTEEGMMQRNLERRGVRAGSGNYNSDIADTSLNRAAAKGHTVNRAIEGERDRVEDTNFNRMATALGRTPNINSRAPGVTAGMPGANLSGASNTAYGAGAQFGGISNTYGNAAGNIASGGIQLGMQAYDLYNKYASPSGVPTYQNTPAAPTNFQAPVSANVNTGFAPTAFADGGPVQAPSLGREVNGAPGVDQVPAYIQGNDGATAPARISEGEYIIPASVVKAIGTDALDDIIMNAESRKNKESSATLTRRIH